MTRADLIARSSKAATPATIDVFDKADKTDGTTKHDTLTKDVTMGNVLIGKFTSMALPAAPVADLKLYFDEKDLGDLWVAVTWSGA